MEPATKLQPTNTKPDSGAKFPMLVSYAFLRETPPPYIAWLLGNPNVEWLLDSGAFTAKNIGAEINLDDYMAFVQQWRKHLFGYIALDKLGDPKQTAENLSVMLKAGLSPIPVHVLGDDGRRMDELFEYSPWVALGGLRRPHRGSASLAYIKQKMLWARGRDVHWLGYTNLASVEAFRPFSCDCASWAACVMYGRSEVFTEGRLQGVTREDILTKPPRLGFLKALNACGFTLAEARDLRGWRRSKDRPATSWVAAQLGARGWVEYGRKVRSYLGTRLFLATIPERGLCSLLFRWVNDTLPAGQQPYTAPAPDAEPQSKPKRQAKRAEPKPRKRSRKIPV